VSQPFGLRSLGLRSGTCGRLRQAMGPHTNAASPASRANRAQMIFPNVDRLNIGPRLTLCFVFIILLMLGGRGLLLWQFHLVRLQQERLTSVGQELIAVLRFQSDLLSFHAKLDELAQSEDADRLKRESGPLRTVLFICPPRPLWIPRFCQLLKPSRARCRRSLRLSRHWLRRAIGRLCASG
jgi:hypothetical protein